MRSLSLLGLPLLLGVACTPLATTQGARVLPPGEFRIGITPGALAVASPEQARLSFAPLLSYRQGLGKGYDLGATLFPAGGSLDLKIALHAEDDLALSLAPYLGVLLEYRGPPVTPYGDGLRRVGQIVDLRLPLLLGLRYGRDHELIFGARLDLLLHRGRRAPFRSIRAELAPGFVLGFDWRLGRHLHLLPALDLSVPLLREPELFGQLGHGILAQLSLSMIIG